MGPLFRAVLGDISQASPDADALVTRSTGAKEKDNQAIKLVYLTLAIDPESLKNVLPAGGWVQLSMDLADGAIAFIKSVNMQATGVVEGVKEWHFPGDFPLFTADEVNFRLTSNQAWEGEISARYMLFYEIVQISALSTLQAHENYIGLQSFG